jgi:hypothetical protein
MNLRREKMVDGVESWEEEAIDPSAYNEEGELIGSATDHFNADLAAEAPAPDNTATIQEDQDAKDAAAAQKLATAQQAQKELAATKAPVMLAFVNSETGAAGLFEGTSPAQAAAAPVQSAGVLTVSPEGAQQLDTEASPQNKNKTATISAMQSPITGKVGLFAGASPLAEKAELETRDFVKSEGAIPDFFKGVMAAGREGYQTTLHNIKYQNEGWQDRDIPELAKIKTPDTFAAGAGKFIGAIGNLPNIIFANKNKSIAQARYARSY